MRRLILALACALAFVALPNLARAWDSPVTAGGYDDFSCASAFGNNGGGCTGLTRPSNTTAYSSGQIVCASTCAPLTIVAGRNNPTSPGSGIITGVSLLKSGNGTSGATFNVFFYSASPTFPASLADQSGYVGPYAADIKTGIYVGSASCSTTNNTSDSSAQVWYVCSINSGGINGLNFKTTGGLLYAVIEATGAYTPASGEKFYVTAYEVQD